MSRIAAALACLLVPASATVPPTPRVLSILQNNTLTWISGLMSDLHRGKAGPDALRDVTAAAWACLALPSNARCPNATSNAMMVISAVLEKQLPDGTFPWNFNESSNVDPNSVEFISLPMTRLLLHYGDALPPAFRAGITANLTAAANAVVDHDVPVYYTNIWTMRAVNLLLWGEVLGNDTLTDMGVRAAQAWLQELSCCGVFEYDSPTYTAVAFNNLISAVADVSNATAVAVLQRCLAFFSAEISASAFVGGVSMAGSHSRDYDFLTGNAGIDDIYILGGLLPDLQPSFVDPITQVQLYINYIRGAQTISDWRFAQSLGDANPYRTLQQVWRQASNDTTPGRDRYTFIARSVAIGSSSYFYGQQDKQINGQLPLGNVTTRCAPRLVEMTLDFDSFDSPYGDAKKRDASGHDKPVKLANSASAVQDGGVILSLNDMGEQFHSQSHWGVYDSIGANVIFPADTEAVFLNGVRVDLQYNSSTSISTDSTVTVYNAGGVLVARMWHLDTLNNISARAYVKVDGTDGTGAARMVGYIYAGPNVTFPSTPTQPSRTGFLFVGAEVTSADQALQVGLWAAGVQLSQSFDGVNWNVTASPPSGSGTTPWFPGVASVLAAGLNVQQRMATYRTVNGTAYAPEFFRIQFANGTLVDVTP